MAKMEAQKYKEKQEYYKAIKKHNFVLNFDNDNDNDNDIGDDDIDFDNDNGECDKEKNRNNSQDHIADNFIHTGAR